MKQLLNSPRLKYLDLSVGRTRISGLNAFWEIHGFGIYLPALRTLCLRSLVRQRSDTRIDSDAAYFMRALVSRTNGMGVEHLQRLMVSRRFVRESDEEEIRGLVSEMVLLDP